jgi:diacylglycerol kinase family enzyme
MRALLLVNPKATTTSERSRDVLVRALRSEVELDVEYTRQRGHAALLAQHAAEQRYDLVVTLGGDGTINEAVNGLLHDGPGDHVPALAVVPGGFTNVFARALGLPKDPVEGTGVILEALQTSRLRTIGLGRAAGRYFTFTAGFGLDAAVVRSVERARLRGRTTTPTLYVRSTLSEFFVTSDRRHAEITMHRPGAPAETGLATVIVQNVAPWTFLGGRAMNACPDASFDTGLDVMAMRSLQLAATVRTVAQILAPRRPHPRGRHVLALHDLSEFTLCSPRPVAFQLDGEYLGDRVEVEFSSVPAALRVVC